MSLLYLNPKGRIQMLAHAMPTHGLLNRGCLAIEIIMVRVKSDGERVCTPHSLVPLHYTPTRLCYLVYPLTQIWRRFSMWIAVSGHIAIIHRQIGHTPSRSHCILYLKAVYVICLFSNMQKRLMMISCTPNNQHVIGYTVHVNQINMVFVSKEEEKEEYK